MRSKVDLDLVSMQPHGECVDGEYRRTYRYIPASDVEPRAVPWTLHIVSIEHTLVQRGPVMGAHVVNRVQGTVDVADRYIPVPYSVYPRLTERDIRYYSYLDKRHLSDVTSLLLVAKSGAKAAQGTVPLGSLLGATLDRPMCLTMNATGPLDKAGDGGRVQDALNGLLYLAPHLALHAGGGLVTDA